jgi:hypothetical protein
MKNESTITTAKSPKTWTRIFIALLSLQALLELGLGGALLIDFPSTVESGFGITYSNELDILGLALGLYLLLLTTLITLSAVWTSRSNYSGISLGILIGLFLITFGVAAFFKIGDTQGLLVDSSRGVITLILAFLAGKELKKNKQ